MDLSIYLPAAGTSVPLLLLIAVGLLVGGLSGFFGVGAGFLLTPLLITLGIPPTVAAASSANHVVASAASGALGHVRSGTVDWRMAVVLLLGGLLGGTAGVRMVGALDATGHADLAIILIHVALLGTLGIRMTQSSLRGLGAALQGRVGTFRRRPLERLADRLPGEISFPRSGVRLSALVPFGAGILVGIVTSFTGVGGGFLLVPLLARSLGVPMPVAVGTVLLQVCLSSANVTFQHAMFNGSVDVVLALVAFGGTLIGTRLGSAAGRRLNAGQLRILLAVTVLFVAAKLALDVTLPPDALVVVARAGGGG